MNLTIPADEDVIDALATHGHVVVDSFLDATLTEALATEATSLDRTGLLKPAGIGRLQAAQLDQALRGDAIRWLEQAHATPPQNAYLERMHRLREHLNRTLYLNLVEFETHFAVYPPGGGYTRHLDQFKNFGDRKISSILYLNQDWQPQNGGQLRLYLDGLKPEPHLDIDPFGGRLVLFDSSRFYHEVLAAKRQRLSLTGWFRTRGDHPLI